MYTQDNVDELKKENIQNIIAIGKFSKNEIEKFDSEDSNIIFVDYSPNENIFDSVIANPFINSIWQLISYTQSF